MDGVGGMLGGGAAQQRRSGGSTHDRLHGTMAPVRPQRLGSEVRPVIGRPEPVDPPPHAEEPLPPAREQLPLPRRRQQAHLEPQLREPGGAGVGTPFAAFSSPAEPGPAIPEQATGGHDGQPPAPERPPAEPGAEVDQPTDRIQLPLGAGDRPADRPTDRGADGGTPGAADQAAADRAAADRAAAFRAATRRGRRPGPPTRPSRG
jgi:hypothetical protein